jgi:hypothetical protein
MLDRSLVQLFSFISPYFVYILRADVELNIPDKARLYAVLALAPQPRADHH